MSLERIFQPITINGMEIKNRIVRASHGTSYGRGVVNEDLIAYHEERAKAGVGLNILEATVVHRSANHTVDWSTMRRSWFRRVAKASQRHGMKTFVQLWHGGIAGRRPTAPRRFLQRPCPLGVVNTPFAMTRDQIDEIIEAFVAASLRVKSAGLEGVELHFGHGYLMHQFLCPLTNKREDDYGGSLEDRLRFGRDMLRAVRGRLGRDYPLGIRISDYNAPGGLTPEEAGEAVHLLCEEKLVDFVSASMGSPYSIASMLGAMDQPAGYMLPSALPIARRADVPTMVAGRYRTLEEGDQAIREAPPT